MFGLFNKKKRNTGLVGISFNDQELALACVLTIAGKSELTVCEVNSATSHTEAAKILAGRTRALGLELTGCNFVLSPDDYSLLLIEAPKVEVDELAAAAQWKIKDMIDRPLDQLVITVMRVPSAAYRNQRDMLYVVAADRNKIEQVIDMVTSAGLELQSIDIPELAMRNIAVHYTDDSLGLAMVDLRHSGSLFNLSKDGAIYLTRHLSTQVGDAILDSSEWEHVKDRLALEIQRSLDYYESQMGQGHINRVLVMPRKQDAAALERELSGAMGARIEIMDLSHKLGDAVQLPPALQQSCLMAIGGALRVEGAP